MAAWVYKVNSRRPGAVKGWHFNQYFCYRGSQPYPMGGSGYIRSPQSWARLAKVRQGDLFVCYQAGERKIYGLARTVSDGYEVEQGSGRINAVDFSPKGLRLVIPVDVRWAEVRELFRHIGAFTVPSRGTIHSLAKGELGELLRALILFNPEQAKDIRRFAKNRKRRK